MKKLTILSAAARAAAMLVLTLVALGCISSLQAQSTQGPFGLARGMTPDAVIAKVGRASVKAFKGDLLQLSTAPAPHPSFDEYSLVFSPNNGLLKIIASSKYIQTNGFGEEIKDLFSTIKAAITKTYGMPQAFDFLRTGSIWDEPRDWMAGLLKKERTLVAYWGGALPYGLQDISLEAAALSTEKGYLLLSYEFMGWGDYVDSKKAKSDDVF